MRRMSHFVLVPSAVVLALSVTACGSDGGSSAPTSVPSAAGSTTSTTAPATASSSPPATATATVTTTASGGSATGGSSGSSGTTLCTPTVMRLTTTRPSGAAGSTYFQIVATNGSSSPCVTTGFPGMALLDASGRQVLEAARDTAVASRTLTVQPGAAVAARVRAGDVPEGGASSCPQAVAFLVTLPDNTDATRFDTSVPSCELSVQAFQPDGG